MSLHQLANHMSAQGRGRDSALVHMTPREVSGLQSLAMAHGGTLTINPETGLPEAGFLDSILPTLLGGAATFFSGGTITPFMAALGVGGLTALTSKDLGKGLMAGLGAYGGSGIMEGLAGFGANAIGAEAATASGSLVDNAAADAASKTAQTGASYSDKLSRGLTEGFKNPMGAVKAIGGGSTFKGAAMVGAPLLSALSSQDQTSVPTPEQIKFDPRYANINISRSQRPYQPDTGSSGERRYFGNTYVNQYADGGAVSNDGIEHFAYGGGTIDPTYDYSGYGPRSNSSGMRPIAYAEAAKPDFVGADGKTYRYDPIKKSWYVIKEAETKEVNAGVKTLMNDGAGGNVNTPSPFDNPGGVRVTPEMSLPVAFLAGKISSAFAGPRQGPAAPVEDREATPVGFSSPTANFGKESTIPTGGMVSPGVTARDAATSASSPTATGGKANSPSGLSALAEAVAAATPAAAAAASAGSDFDARQDEADAAVLAAENSPRPDSVTTPISTPTAIAGGVYVDAKNAAAAQAMQDANAATIAGFSGTGFGDGKGYGGGYGGDGGAGGSNPGGTGRGDGGYGAQANGGMVGRYSQGGLGSLGGYSDGGRLLRGPGDGVSDSIPATVGDRQPARLADGEFVVPARIVSELGNGSTEAGARALYKMMDRIQANRRKTTGKNSVAVNSKSHKYLPA